MKRIVVIADLHSGSVAGLTPPDWQFKESGSRTRRKFSQIQSRVWEWYKQTILKLQPIDHLVVNGDAVDGKGERTGGTELITSDRDEQVAMAAEAIGLARAKKVTLVYGTAYHAGVEEDWEKVLADELNTEVHAHAFVDGDGVIFDCKHFVGSSVVPYGRHTTPARERIWNLLWAERKLQPKGNILIRSHVHYFGFAGTAESLILTTPALQAPSTKYGARRCSGTVDVGLLSFDCEKGKFEWENHLMDLRFLAQKAIAA